MVTGSIPSAENAPLSHPRSACGRELIRLTQYCRADLTVAQAIADLLESSASWYTPGGGPSARNSDLLFPPPPLLDGDGFRESNEDMVAAASGKRSTADAHAHEVEAAVAEIDGAINGTMEKLSNGLFAETAIDDFRTRNGQLQPTIIGDGMGDGGVASIDDADGGLGELDWVQDGREGEEGARLHAYQVKRGESLTIPCQAFLSFKAR